MKKKTLQGILLLGSAVMGIDALPMEGLDLDVLNEAFDLDSQGLKAICAVFLEYRTDTDFNSSLHF